MKLKNIFNQVKSEGFVQDAWTPESVNKPRQAIEKKLPGLASGGQSKDAACETEDKVYKDGDIAHRKDGDYRRISAGKWVPVKKNGTGSKEAAGGKRDISAENRAFHEKADKERAERKARADSKASAARKEAEERKLSGVEMKDFFLAKAYEGASVEMTQRGLEAQGFDLLEANDKVNVYERPEGSRITMQLEGNKIKSAEYQTPAETAKEARSERANPTPAQPKRESVSAGRMSKDLDGNFWSRPDDFKEDITSRGWDVEEMNNEYAVISNEAGSQYEVRFNDHGDNGDLTVRTFKPLMIDEDDEELEDAAPTLASIFEEIKK